VTVTDLLEATPWARGKPRLVTGSHIPLRPCRTAEGSKWSPPRTFSQLKGSFDEHSRTGEFRKVAPRGVGALV